MSEEIKHKIYCFNNGGSPGFMSAVALADDGHCIAGHCCSHEGFMRHDLGMDRSTRKHKDYNKHFGEGNWELEWVAAVDSHEGCKAALALNALLPKEDDQESVESLELATGRASA